MLSAQSGFTLLPSLIHAASNTAKKTTKVPITQDIELDASEEMEELRAYHVQLDLQSSIDNSEQSDVDWQVKRKKLGRLGRTRENTEIFSKLFGLEVINNGFPWSFSFSMIHIYSIDMLTRKI